MYNSYELTEYTMYISEVRVLFLFGSMIVRMRRNEKFYEMVIAESISRKCCTATFRDECEFKIIQKEEVEFGGNHSRKW